MTLFRAPALDWAAPIVDPKTGRITPYFQRFWQNLSFTADSAAGQVTDITALQSAVTALGINKLNKSPFSAWSAATGTAERTTFATYTAPTISASPTQAEVQALANHVQVLSRRLKALIDDVKQP